MALRIFIIKNFKGGFKKNNNYKNSGRLITLKDGRKIKYSDHKYLNHKDFKQLPDDIKRERAEARRKNNDQKDDQQDSQVSIAEFNQMKSTIASLTGKQVQFQEPTSSSVSQVSQTSYPFTMMGGRNEQAKRRQNGN